MVGSLLLSLSLFFQLSGSFASSALAAPSVSHGEKGLSHASPTNEYRISVKIPHFLGNAERKYYGEGPVPGALSVLWKKYLGKGKTRIWGKTVELYGTGWTGQPALVEENEKLYLLFGSLNHILYKVEALTGKSVWEHRFNDVIKASPLLFINPKARNAGEKGIVFCGSRGRLKGRSGNYRALSLLTGKELWSFSPPLTDSYSTDVDSDGLVLDGLLYLPAENGLLYTIDTDISRRYRSKSGFSPPVIRQQKLYTKQEITQYSNNLTLESSVSLLEGRLYLSSSFGSVFGIEPGTGAVSFRHLIGADINSTPVVTHDGCLLVGTELQYVTNAGVYKLNPRKNSTNRVEWFFPVKKTNVGGWQGGVIGSVAVNDRYNPGEHPYLCAFTCLDGHLYLLDQKTGGLVWKQNIGSSVSTPLFTHGHIIAGTYEKRLHVFKVDYVKTRRKKKVRQVLNSRGEPYDVRVTEKAVLYIGGEIESTPVVWSNRIFFGAKNGYFYCVGEE